MQNFSLILFFLSTFCPTLPHTKWALYENSFYASLKPGIIASTAYCCYLVGQTNMGPLSKNNTNTNILPKYSIE